jgi:hypothetical protein
MAQAESWGESHGAKNIRRLEQHVFPWIGQQAIANVKRANIRGVLRRIEGTGRVETAYRVLQLCRAILEYAIAEEICEHTPKFSVVTTGRSLDPTSTTYRQLRSSLGRDRSS